MPKPIDRSAPAVLPEQPDAEPTHAPTASPAAMDAVESIEWSWHKGVWPDMESIERDLSSLGGFDLLQAAHTLEDRGELEPMLNRMSSNERQGLINDLVKNGIVEREDPPRGKLVARYTLPESMKAMLGELNALQSREHRPADATRFNWSSYQEGPGEDLVNQVAPQVRAMKPGDSVKLEAKAGLFGAALTGGAEFEVGIARAEDGTYRVSKKVGAEAGLLAYSESPLAELRLEGGAGGSASVEYSFPTANAALAAAKTMMNPADAPKGKPSAIELEGKLAGDVIAHLGAPETKVIHGVLGGGGSVSARIDLDSKPPALVIKAESKGHAEVGKMLGVGHAELEFHGTGAGAESTVEVEARIPVDPDALLRSPKQYLQEHGAELAAAAELKATVSWERSVLHHGTAGKLTVTAPADELLGFVHDIQGTKPWRPALMALSKKAEVDFREQDLKLDHHGIGGRLETHAGGGELSVGYQVRSVEKERVLYQGSAYDFAREPNR